MSVCVSDIQPPQAADIYTSAQAYQNSKYSNAKSELLAIAAQGEADVRAGRTVEAKKLVSDIRNAFAL